VVEGEGHQRTLRCRYHGRRFALDGTMTFMPEFEGVRDFPSDADNLKRVETAEWGRFLFGRLDGREAFDSWISPMRERMAFFPVDELRLDATASRDYAVQANWALYVENYLEPFHIAYVHQQSLGGALDYNAYRTELYPQSSLQLGVAAAGEDAFELPTGHADSGTRVAAYYWWLYPGLMLNFYPWGLSVNVVQPLGPNRTRVSFLTYVLDESRRNVGAGADVHRVELEDEEIVESVQRGLRSRLYKRGRYAPHRETGTHHFHRLLVRSLQAEDGAAG
jgi:choline monooxygenase